MIFGNHLASPRLSRVALAIIFAGASQMRAQSESPFVIYIEQGADSLLSAQGSAATVLGGAGISIVGEVTTTKLLNGRFLHSAAVNLEIPNPAPKTLGEWWQIAHVAGSSDAAKLATKNLNATQVFIELEPGLLPPEAIGLTERRLGVFSSEKEEQKVRKQSNALWAYPEDPTVAWHLDNTHSRLTEARDSLIPNPDDSLSKIKVAILDNDIKAFGPKALYDEFFGETWKYESNEGEPDKFSINFGGKNHGLGTASLLYRKTPSGFGAASGVQPSYYVIRKKGVIHLSSARMAKALSLARENGADVVSISAGGFTGTKLENEIRLCYENGVVVVAAAGNYYRLSLLGSVGPRTSVYPAALPQVIAAYGVDYGGHPYRTPRYPWKWANIFGFSQRGSAGPDWVSAHAIAAYTPYIRWANFDGSFHSDGAGTSSATPQIAAAAALWLAKNKSSYEGQDKWRIVEATRQALLQGARAPESSHSKTQIASTHIYRHLGRGIIDAQASLKLSPAEIGELKKEAAGLDNAELDPFLRLLLSLIPNILKDVIEKQFIGLAIAEVRSAAPDFELSTFNTTGMANRPFPLVSAKHRALSEPIYIELSHHLMLNSRLRERIYDRTFKYVQSLEKSETVDGHELKTMLRESIKDISKLQDISTRARDYLKELSEQTKDQLR